MISIKNQTDQEIETRTRHPLDKADNIYFEINSFPFDGIGPLPTNFSSFQRSIPILYEMSDYEICVSGFNIDIDAITNKTNVKGSTSFAFRPVIPNKGSAQKGCSILVN